MGYLLRQNELKPRYGRLKYFSDFILRTDFSILYLSAWKSIIVLGKGILLENEAGQVQRLLL